MKIINKKEHQALLVLPILTYVSFFVIYFLATFTDFVWADSMEKYLMLFEGFLRGILPIVLYSYIAFIIFGMPSYILLKKLNWLNFASFWLLSLIPAATLAILAIYFYRQDSLTLESLVIVATWPFISYQMTTFIYWLKSGDRISDFYL